jgi:hypothetical protein
LKRGLSRTADEFSLTLLTGLTNAIAEPVNAPMTRFEAAGAEG